MEPGTGARSPSYANAIHKIEGSASLIVIDYNDALSQQGECVVQRILIAVNAVRQLLQLI